MPFWAFPFWGLISHKRKSSCSLLWQEGLRAQGRSWVLRVLGSELEKPRKEEEDEGNTRGQTAFIRVLRRLGPCEGENLPRVGFKAWDGDRAPRTKKEMAKTSASLLSKLWETPQNSEEHLWKEARGLGMKNWAGYHCTLWPQSSHVSDGVWSGCSQALQVLGRIFCLGWSFRMMTDLTPNNTHYTISHGSYTEFLRPRLCQGLSVDKTFSFILQSLE